MYAGAENWSGCVYFTENLAAEDCFGPAAVAAAPYERPVHRRGTLLHNGLDVVGVELTDPAVFKNCYTVLRPVYDPYFAHLARKKGAVLLTNTTVTSLIRKEGRVIGVETNCGPLYANVTFIAEGDASHLVRVGAARARGSAALSAGREGGPVAQARGDRGAVQAQARRRRRLRAARSGTRPSAAGPRS